MNYKKIILLGSLVAILIGVITLTTINSKKNISKSNKVQIKSTRESMKERIEKKGSTDVMTTNYGKTGDRSERRLATILTKKKSQKDIKNANVITMTAGGDELMQVMEKSFSSMADDKLQSVLEKSP